MKSLINKIKCFFKCHDFRRLIHAHYAWPWKTRSYLWITARCLYCNVCCTWLGDFNEVKNMRPSNEKATP